MKKLFTLLAFLTCFMGAKAEWVTDYTIDYSTSTGFPFYVMGYVPEWVDGVMTDFGAMYIYKTDSEMEAGGDWTANVSSEVGTVTTGGGAVYHKLECTSAQWHQYFIADGITTELDGSYTVKALVKASEAVTINVNMGWGWSEGQSLGAQVSIPAGDEFQEVEWTYTGVGGTSCNLVAQPGSSTATIEWKSLTVSHNQKQQAAVEWLQLLTNGDAEAAWPAWALEKDGDINANWRTDKAPEICAWSLTMGKNFDDQCAEFGEAADRSRPYPADIEAEAGNESNHVFAVHVDQIDKIDEDASIAWSNQFWIQAPQAVKNGTKVRIKFRYKADHACNAGTQWHKKNPSVYNDWNAAGDVSFTEQWQEFDKTLTMNVSGTYSLAFNLCSDETNGRTPNVFYFDDLSWEIMKLEDGLFVTGSNADKGIEYDFANAIKFDEIDDNVFTATVGEENAWVKQVMISTVRGDDGAFKGSTIKPTKQITDIEDWYDYTESSVAKIDLPAAGIWQITINTEDLKIHFDELEGEQIVVKEAVDVVTNATEVTVKGQEREYTEAEAEAAGIEKPENPGQAWDNQFFIVANRVLKAGEVTIVKFQYKANKEARTTTQTHGAPGAYIHWAAIGDVNFTEEWQDFTYEYTIPAEAEGKDAQSIAFNMAEIKEACNYELKNFQWYLKSDEEGKTLENLIDAEGTKNFFVKEGAGTNPYQFGTDPSGIINVKKDAVKADGAIYNLAGQRVNKNYKGIVVKNGKKTLNF
jgi:hypothetical protein